MRPATTFFIFLFPLLSFSQNLFVNTFGINSAEERAFDMVVLSDGSIITAGDRYDTDNSQRTGHLLKVDPFGLEEWNRQLLSNQDLYATTICQLPNGNVFVAGYDLDVPDRNFGIMVAQYNASNGLPVFQLTHQFDQDAEAKDVVPMPDNGAIVLSTFETPSTNTILLVRFNADGDTVWTKLVNPYLGNEDPRELAMLSDGLIITGSVHSGSNDNVFIIKTDINGNLLWEEEHPSGAIAFGEGIAEIPTGGFYIAGITNAIGNGGLDVLAMKVDASGQLLWAKGFGRSGNELGYDVDVMPDGGAIFTGSAFKADTSNFRDLVLIRTDTDGDTLWTRFFGGHGSETGYEVKVDDQQIVVCGKGDVDNSEDVIVARVDFNGNTAVGINELENTSAWNVFPNPFTDHITLSTTQPISHPLELSVTDMLGREHTFRNVDRNERIDLSELPSGVYLLRVGRSNGRIIVKK